MTQRPGRTRRRSVLALLFAAGLALAGCSAVVAENHNDADTEFAQMMIVHHEGAIEMADLAVQRATDSQVKALAGRITAAQGPEIELMQGWLDGWGEARAAEADHAGMDHGGMEMEGLDQGGAMAELEALSGPGFDARFLTLMIAHHEGAVEMSKGVIADGVATEVAALAEQIIEAQQGEIAEMSAMVAELSE